VRPKKKRRRLTQTRSSKRWLVIGGGLAAAAVSIVVVVLLLTRGGGFSGKSGPGRHVVTRVGKVQNIEALAYAPDGKRLALGTFIASTGRIDRSIQVWDLTADQEIMTLEAHDDITSHLAFSPDGKLLASSSGNVKEIKIWDLDSRALRHRLRIAEGAPGLGGLLLAFDLSGKHVISICQGYVVRLNVETGKEDREILSINRTAHAACSPVAPLVAIAQVKGPPITTEMDIYDYQTSKVQTIAISNSPTDLAFSRDGSSLAMATAEGPIHVFDTTTWKVRATLDKKRGGKFLYYQQIELNPDGTLLFGVPMASGGPNIDIWKVGDPDTRPLELGFGDRLTFSPDGKTVAVALHNIGDGGPGLVFADPKTGIEKAP
jgi:WD40 repeat protein